MEDIRIYTLKDTSDILKLSYQTVLKLVDKGYLAAVKHGGQWRVTQKEIDRFKNEGNLKDEDDSIIKISGDEETEEAKVEAEEEDDTTTLQ